MEPRNPDHEALVNELARAVQKAQVAYRIAMRRLDEKLARLEAVKNQYREALAVHGWDTFPPTSAPFTPNSGVTDGMALVVNHGLSTPSLAEVARHFEVGEGEAQAIIDFAEAHGDDLRIVILRGWHRR